MATSGSAAVRLSGTHPIPEGVPLLLSAWFREHVRQVHGVVLEKGFSPPEQILDYRSEPLG